jgi:endonuclease/exonuclease/phosphatase (EEP) superfamily protein YafD
MPRKSWNLLKNTNRKALLFVLVSFHYILVRAEYVVPNPENVITNIGEAKQEELDPGSIKMLIWNLYKGQRDSFEDSFLKLIKSKNILILQEMYLDRKMLSLFNGLSGFSIVGATSFMDDGIRTGVLTASQSTVRDSRYIKSNFTEPLSRTPKMSLLNYYSVRGFKSHLLVVNIHAINFVTISEYENQLKDLFLKVKEYRGPIIFAGDFNTWSLGRMELLKGYINKLKLKEVHFEKDDRLKF